MAPQLLLWTTCLSLPLGCVSRDDGPETVPVYGTVTLDGEPVADANITFAAANPVDRLRTVTGITNAEGKYTLDFSLSKSGAQPGHYVVSVSTYREAAEDDNGQLIPARPETIPQSYNLKTTLTAEVAPNQPEHNFELIRIPM